MKVEVLAGFAALTVVGAVHAQQEGKPDLSGAWQLTIADPQVLNPFTDAAWRRSDLVIVQDGDHVTATWAPAKDLRVTAKGEVKAGDVRLKAGDLEIELEGTVMDGATLAGEVRTPAGVARWTAVLVGVWKCSGHEPAHTAMTLEQMKALTLKHGCKGWARVKGTDTPERD